MYICRKYAMYQVILACLMYMSLAGETQLKNRIRRDTSSNQTNASSNATNNKTTPSSKESKAWFDLEQEDKRKIRTVSVSVSVVGVALNIVVIVAIVIDPLKVLRKGPWITILSLATADLISCISAFCIWGWKYFTHGQDELYFTIADFLWMFGASGSFLMLTFLTVQIFIITKFPIKSRCWLTTTKIILLGMGLWVLSVLLGLSNIAWLHYHWKKAFKIYIAQIAILEVATATQVILNIRIAIEIIRSGRVTGNAHVTKHKNIAKTVMILTVILFFTAFPYFVFKQLEHLARLQHFGKSNTGKVLFAISYCYTPIALLNFVANPILYSLRLPDYRNSLLAFICKKKRDIGSSSATMRYTLTSTFSLRNQRASDTSQRNGKQ